MEEKSLSRGVKLRSHLVVAAKPPLAVSPQNDDISKTLAAATKPKTALHFQESCCKSNGGGRILLLRRVVQRSLISRLPRWQTCVACPRPRWDTAVAQGASRANHARARTHQTPQVVFCASPSAASAAAPRLRCRGMFSVWASAPHAPLCGVRVPATGHCACRYAHGPHVLELG